MLIPFAQYTKNSLLYKRLFYFLLSVLKTFLFQLLHRCLKIRALKDAICHDVHCIYSQAIDKANSWNLLERYLHKSLELFEILEDLMTTARPHSQELLQGCLVAQAS